MPQTSCGFADSPLGLGYWLLIQNGPSLFVDIGFDPTYDPSGESGKPQPGITGVWALVDTGATKSCIDIQLATSLNLPIIDRQPYGGAGGLHVADIYLAQIHVPTLDRTIYGDFAGVDLAGGGQAHKALIGRTFLRAYTMIYNGVTGEVTIFS